MKIKIFILFFFFNSLIGYSQVTNDSCLSAIDLGNLPFGSVVSVPCFSGVPCIIIEDSTDLAVANFPYPSIPNSCIGYTSSVVSPGNDMWYKFTVHCDFSFRVENSDTLHLSFWIGDTCSNLLPLACYTNPANNLLSQALTGLGGHTVYLQVSSQNAISQNSFTICLAANLPFCAPAFDLTQPTPVMCFEYNINSTPCTNAAVNDGTVSISVINGNGPFTCNWSDGYVGLDRDSMPSGKYIFTLTDVYGCLEVDSVQINISLATGVIENFMSNPLYVFFNSLDGVLNINLNESIAQIHSNYSVIINDITGRIVYENNLSGNEKIKFNEKKGLYVIRVNSDTFMYHKKIVITY